MFHVIMQIEFVVPLAAMPFLVSRQARMIRAPLFAKSMAVSLPIPVLAPVMMTVLPVS